MRARTEEPESNGNGQTEPPADASPEEKKTEQTMTNIVGIVEKYIADVMAKADADDEYTASKIIDQQRKVAQLNIALLRIKTGEKEIKNRLEVEVERLDSLQREEDRNNTPAPLYDDPGLRNTNTADDQAAFNTATLDDLGIVGAMADKLEADGIRTGEQLQRWFAEHPPRKIDGIGQGARDKISEAMAKFYEDRKAAREQAEPAAATV